MSIRSEIAAYGRKIGERFAADRVVLFGSQAQGAAQPDSDVDILVILAHDGKGWKKAAEIRDALPPPFPADVLVRSPEEIERRLALGDDFFRTILEKGETLYESTSS